MSPRRQEPRRAPKSDRGKGRSYPEGAERWKAGEVEDEDEEMLSKLAFADGDDEDWDFDDSDDD